MDTDEFLELLNKTSDAARAIRSFASERRRNCNKETRRICNRLIFAIDRMTAGVLDVMREAETFAETD